MLKDLIDVLCRDASTYIVALPILFALEMVAASSMHESGLIPQSSLEKWILVIVCKVPILGLCAIFLPPIGCALFLATTAISVITIIRWHICWKTHQHGAQQK